MALTDRVTLSYNCGPKGRAGQGGKATTRGNAAQLTTGNITGQDTKLSAWTAAAQALSMGQIERQAFDHGISIDITPPGPLNKGEKWVVTMQESTGNKRFFTHSIPAANDDSSLVLAGTLDADLSATAWVNYISAANALLTTPDGNAMVFSQATLLTRRR